MDVQKFFQTSQQNLDQKGNNHGGAATDTDGENLASNVAESVLADPLYVSVPLDHPSEWPTAMGAPRREARRAENVAVRAAEDGVDASAYSCSCSAAVCHSVSFADSLRAGLARPSR